MFGYAITIIVTIFIVSIITEHMVIQRLQMSSGVEIINGRCRLKQGFGKLNTPVVSQSQIRAPRENIITEPINHNEMHDDYYRPFVR